MSGVIIAYAWRTGLLEMGPRMPFGALPVAEGRGKDFRDKVSARARHGYDGSLLVPGVPEAESDDEALEAMERFRAWMER